MKNGLKKAKKSQLNRKLIKYSLEVHFTQKGTFYWVVLFFVLNC